MIQSSRSTIFQLVPKYSGEGGIELLDYLVKLMEGGEFQKCLRLAEQQLLKGGWSINELAKINLMICRCRLGIQDPHGAVVAGSMATNLARDSKDWDLFGRIALNLGTAYTGTRQYGEALQSLYGYFEHLNAYTASTRRFEGAIWKNIGIAHQHLLETTKAIDALTRARDWYAQAGIQFSTFTCTHDLLHTYLQHHSTEQGAPIVQVEQLLDAEKAFVKQFPGESYFESYSLYDQAAYYAHIGRYARATVSAQKAMDLRKADRWIGFHGNMVLHDCSQARADHRQALGYALAARVHALQGRYFELEFLASQAMAEIIKHQGEELVRELDEEYQAMGVDLGQYLSPDVLRRDH
jgi:tetratricopeptide (TPR) repeat protein